MPYNLHFVHLGQIKCRPAHGSHSCIHQLWQSTIMDKQGQTYRKLLHQQCATDEKWNMKSHKKPTCRSQKAHLTHSPVITWLSTTHHSLINLFLFLMWQPKASMFIQYSCVSNDTGCFLPSFLSWWEYHNVINHEDEEVVSSYLLCQVSPNYIRSVFFSNPKITFWWYS